MVLRVELKVCHYIPQRQGGVAVTRRLDGWGDGREGGDGVARDALGVQLAASGTWATGHFLFIAGPTPGSVSLSLLSSTGPTR